MLMFCFNMNPIFAFEPTGQCLYTACDNNPALVSQLSQSEVMTHLQKLITTTHDSTEALLLRTLATGQSIMGLFT